MDPRFSGDPNVGRMDPNDPKSAGWAGRGGKPVYVNLNANSTHPRPWRPPTDWEHVLRIYDPYKIHQDDSPQYFRRTHNWIEDDPFFKNLYWASKKGFGFGEKRERMLDTITREFEMYSRDVDVQRKLVDTVKIRCHRINIHHTFNSHYD